MLSSRCLLLQFLSPSFPLMPSAPRTIGEKDFFFFLFERWFKFFFFLVSHRKKKKKRPTSNTEKVKKIYKRKEEKNKRFGCLIWIFFFLNRFRLLSCRLSNFPKSEKKFQRQEIKDGKTLPMKNKSPNGFQTFCFSLSSFFRRSGSQKKRPKNSLRMQSATASTVPAFLICLRSNATLFNKKVPQFHCTPKALPCK